ncbi:MAG: hypothetical protein ACK54X_12855, partial [Burkholderiales bacterium]
MESATDHDPAGRPASPLRAWASAFASVATLGAGARASAAPSAAEEGHRRALESARHYRHLYYSAPVALVSSDA